MQQAPKWFIPVAITALLWNLVGCVAYLSDVMMSPEDVAAMPAEMQALYAARPGWAIAATAFAVWGGAAGSVGLIMRKRWASLLLVASLAALAVQNVWLFVLSEVPADSTAVILQSMVLVIAVALVMLARKAAAREWIA